MGCDAFFYGRHCECCVFILEPLSLCSSVMKCMFVFDRSLRPSYLPCKCAVSVVESFVLLCLWRFPPVCSCHEDVSSLHYTWCHTYKVLNYAAYTNPTFTVSVGSILRFMCLPLVQYKQSVPPDIWQYSTDIRGISGTAVAQWLRCYATNRRVACSIPDGFIGIFHWHNPSDRTVALGSTQPLREMSTRSVSWR